MPEETPSASAVRRGAERVLAHVIEEQEFSNWMLEAMPGILYLYDEHGHFLRWNRNFETASGYAGAEIARMHPREFFRAEDQPLLMQRIAEVFTSTVHSMPAGSSGRTTIGNTRPRITTAPSALHALNRRRQAKPNGLIAWIKTTAAPGGGCHA